MLGNDSSVGCRCGRLGGMDVGIGLGGGMKGFGCGLVGGGGGDGVTGSGR